MQCYFHRKLDPIIQLDMPLVCHEDNNIYVICLVTLLEHARTVRGLMCLKSCCLDRPDDRCNLI